MDKYVDKNKRLKDQRDELQENVESVRGNDFKGKLFVNYACLILP